MYVGKLAELESAWALTWESRALLWHFKFYSWSRKFSYPFSFLHCSAPLHSSPLSLCTPYLSSSRIATLYSAMCSFKIDSQWEIVSNRFWEIMITRSPLTHTEAAAVAKNKPHAWFLRDRKHYYSQFLTYCCPDDKVLCCDWEEGSFHRFIYWLRLPNSGITLFWYSYCLQHVTWDT